MHHDSRGPHPALSIRQPRLSRSTDYRGPILIHASSHPNEDAEDEALTNLDMSASHFRSLPRGAYLGIVTLVSVKRTPNAPDAYTFTLSHSRRFTDPIPGRGHPGLYWPDAELWEVVKGKVEKYRHL